MTKAAAAHLGLLEFANSLTTVINNYYETYMDMTRREGDRSRKPQPHTDLLRSQQHAGYAMPRGIESRSRKRNLAQLSESVSSCYGHDCLAHE